MKRPDCIAHYTELQDEWPGRYRGNPESLSLGAPLGRKLGLTRIGIHHETLPPGRRTSWPHAESKEEEFVYVLEGNPSAWIDGNLYELRPGDAIGFPAGTGICHTILNNTAVEVRLLVVGEANKPDNQVFYPLNPERKINIGSYWWEDVPRRPQGPHDGMPRIGDQK
jgi:uncharacterized cupin superfamily protein